MPPQPPLPAQPFDWTAVRGLGNSDCNTSAVLVRAPVAAVVDALVAGIAQNKPRTVVRDVFAKCARFAMNHRLAYRLRDHAWTCLAGCRRWDPWSFDSHLLSDGLRAWIAW